MTRESPCSPHADGGEAGKKQERRKTLGSLIDDIVRELDRHTKYHLKATERESERERKGEREGEREREREIERGRRLVFSMRYLPHCL